MSSRPAKKRLLRELRAQHEGSRHPSQDVMVCRCGWTASGKEIAAGTRMRLVRWAWAEFWVKQAHLDAALSRLRRAKGKRQRALMGAMWKAAA